MCPGGSDVSRPGYCRGTGVCPGSPGGSDVSRPRYCRGTSVCPGGSDVSRP